LRSSREGGKVEEVVSGGGWGRGGIRAWDVEGGGGTECGGGRFWGEGIWVWGSEC